MKQCYRCGHDVRNDTKFCENCGASQSVPNSSIPSAPTRPQSTLSPPVVKKRQWWAWIAIVCIGLLVTVCCIGPALWQTFRSRGVYSADAVALPTPTLAPVIYRRPDVRDLVKNPDAYRGSSILIRGEVFTITENNDGAIMQIWVRHPDGSEFDREAVIVTYNGSTDSIYKESVIEVLGFGIGSYEGSNAFGASIRQPAIKADQIDLIR
jgi:hypothetical protein